MASVLTVYSRMYAGCVMQALRAIGKNPWTLLLPMAMGIAMVLLLNLLASALPGLVAGILWSLALDAMLSAYLYFLSEMLFSQRVHLRELKTAFGAYFWSILNLMFVLWIARMLLQVAGAVQWQLFLYLLVFVVLPSLEVIYLRRAHGGLQTIQEGFEFLKENWIEWYLPVIPAMVAVGAIYIFASTIDPLVGVAVGGAFFHVLMAFRGQLFKELAGSSHRQRMFKHRNA